MDSVIVFFGSATYEEVEHEASLHGLAAGSRGAEHTHLWRYSEQQVNAEYELGELGAVRKALGSEIKSAFQVACRHGESARSAIQVVNSLMSQFKPSVLDDDFGTLWQPEEVAACAELAPENGLYALRKDA